jgi:hypothetical protein
MSSWDEPNLDEKAKVLTPVRTNQALMDEAVVAMFTECKGFIRTEIPIERICKLTGISPAAYRNFVDENLIREHGSEACSLTQAGMEKARALLKMSQEQRQAIHILHLINEIVDGKTTRYFPFSTIEPLWIMPNGNLSDFPGLFFTIIFVTLHERGYIKLFRDRRELSQIDESLGLGNVDIGDELQITTDGVKYCESAGTETRPEFFSEAKIQHMSNIVNVYGGNASGFAVGSHAKASTDQKIGLQGEEVAMLLEEMNIALETVSKEQREALALLLKVIGEKDARPETKEEARSVAQAAQAWLGSLGVKAMEKVSLEQFIELGKLGATAYISHGGHIPGITG